MMTQTDNIINEMMRPNWVPKNCLNTAPVYPSNAEMSNFNKMSVRDKSIGFNIVPTKDNLSSG